MGLPWSPTEPGRAADEITQVLPRAFWSDGSEIGGWLHVNEMVCQLPASFTLTAAVKVPRKLGTLSVDDVCFQIV